MGAGPERDLTGVIAEHLPAGPGLAAWLGNADPAEFSDWDLPGIAAAYRRVASWALAGELAAVAAIASRTAARDARADVGGQGRPDRVTAGAACEVSLALRMSQSGASWWTRLGVELAWRLAETGAALAAGVIDLGRARLIAEAAGPLTDEDARAVQALVLPAAGGQTTGQLRAALRRAVLRCGRTRRAPTSCAPRSSCGLPPRPGAMPLPRRRRSGRPRPRPAGSR